MMKRTGVFLSLAAILAACLLASCIKIDNSLGSSLVSTSQDITIQTATLDLPLQSMRTSGDLQSRMNGGITVGSIGTDFSSEGLVSVSASTDSIVWGKNPTVRRVYLSMVCDTCLVMEDGQRYIPQNIHVHRLNFELDSTYYSSADERFKTRYYDAEPISVSGGVFTGGEAWSVELKKEIGEELLRFPMATLDSAQLFMKQFYGFCLRSDDPDDERTSPKGEGRLNIFNLSTSYLILNWDYTDDEGNRKNASTYFGLGSYHAVNLYRTLKPTSGTRDEIVVQGLSGSKPHISGKQLRQTVDAWAAQAGIPTDNLVIAKATLEFPFEYSGDRSQFDNYAANLYPCQRSLNSRGIPIYAPISEIDDTALEDGTIDRSLLYYKSNISIYLQELIRMQPDEIDDEDDLWIMPTSSYYNSNTGVTYHYADNYYYTETHLNGMRAARHSVLRLTYSVLK